MVSRKMRHFLTRTKSCRTAVGKKENRQTLGRRPQPIESKQLIMKLNWRHGSLQVIGEIGPAGAPSRGGPRASLGRPVRCAAGGTQCRSSGSIVSRRKMEPSCRLTRPISPASASILTGWVGSSPGIRGCFIVDVPFTNRCRRQSNGSRSSVPNITARASRAACTWRRVGFSLRTLGWTGHWTDNPLRGLLSVR
jgi:hypothetical protein